LTKFKLVKCPSFIFVGSHLIDINVILMSKAHFVVHMRIYSTIQLFIIESEDNIINGDTVRLGY